MKTTNEPFEGPGYRRILTSGNRRVLTAQVCSWLAILLVAVLAITALTKCITMEQHLRTVALQAEPLNQPEIVEESRLVKILTEGKSFLMWYQNFHCLNHY